MNPVEQIRFAPPKQYAAEDYACTKSRVIAHLDLDTFFVSVERLQNSSLDKKPVIIGGMGDRGVVAGCSYEARRFGVHSAMPVKMARYLCPQAVFIRGDLEAYNKYSRMVTGIIAEKAPVFEKASIDEHYLDLSGMDRFFGCRKWASELRQTIIRETGLPISMGLSVNKTVSKIATGEAKPNGHICIGQDMVHPFMDPLSIRKIPMIGPKTYHSLRTMGIATIQTLRQIPPDVMENMLGKNGLSIWQRANGIDNAPVLPWQDHDSVSSETTFESDTTDRDFLHGTLVSMCEQLAYRLRRKQQLTGCITIKVRYANFDTHTLQQTLPYTSFDHILIPACKTLFDRLYKRRMLLRLIGIRFSKLVYGVQQLSLFDHTTEHIRLYQAIDLLRKKYGAKIIHKAGGKLRKSVESLESDRLTTLQTLQTL